MRLRGCRLAATRNFDEETSYAAVNAIVKYDILSYPTLAAIPSLYIRGKCRLRNGDFGEYRCS